MDTPRPPLPPPDRRPGPRLEPADGASVVVWLCIALAVILGVLGLLVLL